MGGCHSSSDCCTGAPPGTEGIDVRFKNRQVTPTLVPTATPTSPVSPLPTPIVDVHKLYLPMLLFEYGEVCTEGVVKVLIFGNWYVFPLEPDGTVKSIEPLPWNELTLSEVLLYDGPLTWTQYQPSTSNRWETMSLPIPADIPERSSASSYVLNAERSP